jgi:peptidoglycan/xylan/chitin deacetylase (PgdA/CDA1 family)
VNGIAILTYHSLDTSGSVVSVAPAEFAAQMACLAEMGVRGIALREAVAHRRAAGEWPPNSMVLTFDDGYASFCEVAMPVLRRHAFRATVFPVTGHVGGRNDWASPVLGLGLRPMLSWEQLGEVSRDGMEIGAHTRAHRDPQRIPPSAVAEEILASRDAVERRLGFRVESFAYPFGIVTSGAREVVRREFRAGCTTVLKRVSDEPFELLPRIDMYYVRTVSRLQRLVNGRLDRFLAARRLARAIRHVLSG